MVVRTTDEMLRLVPSQMREAALSLGIPQWKTIARVVVPTALPGIISGILLALARVIGETAPVLVLVGYAFTSGSFAASISCCRNGWQRTEPCP